MAGAEQRTSHGPLRHIISAMLNATVRLAVAHCTTQKAAPCRVQPEALKSFTRNARRPAAQSSISSPSLARPSNKATQQTTLRKSTLYTACARRRCARHQKPCRARSSAFARSSKDPAHVRQLKMAPALRASVPIFSCHTPPSKPNSR